jgi:hypothetical protein
VGRNARLKRERKLKRVREGWDQFLHPSYLAEIRKMILSSGTTPDSCICGTKVLCQIGASLDLRVEPLVVEAYIYNAGFVLHFANNDFNITEADMKKIVEGGGRFVVLGRRIEPQEPPKPGKWAGHLVAVVHPPKGVNEQPRVVDISIDQAHHPENGLLLQEPAIFPVVKGFLSGANSAIGLTEVGGVQMCMIYKAHPDDTSYEASPDWQRDYEAKAHDGVPIDRLPEKTPVDDG